MGEWVCDGHVALVGVSRGVFEKLCDVVGEWLVWRKVRNKMVKMGCKLLPKGIGDDDGLSFESR